MLLVVFASIAGGLVTGGALLPQGLLIAFLGAQLGGSLSAVLAGLVNLYRQEPAWQFEAELEAQTDALVAELRSVLARSPREDGMASRPSQSARRVA